MLQDGQKNKNFLKKGWSYVSGLFDSSPHVPTNEDLVLSESKFDGFSIDI